MDKPASDNRDSYAEKILQSVAKTTPVFADPAELLQKVLDTIPQKVFWKDRDLVYLGCNQLFANDAGLASPQEIIGLTDFDLPWEKSEAEFYRDCDRRIMDGDCAEIGIEEPQLTANGERTWLATNKVPLHDDVGNVIGILGTYHDITKQKMAESALMQSNEELEKRVTERTQELQYLAQHDSLTGLINRSCFVNQLNDTIKNSGLDSFGLLFVDLDNFKPINDIYGHEAGDYVLTRVAEILSDEVDELDLVGRFGGDEFVVMLRSVGVEQQANEICDRIQERLSCEINLLGENLPVSASIGISFSDAANYSNADEMLRDADIAMYVAKAGGDVKFCIQDSETIKRVRRSRAFEHEIQLGIINREFTLRYQPIINLQQGTLSNFEALVRWEHPQRGLVSPLEFIPVAEKVGLIFELGELILRDACTQMKYWWDRFPTCRDRLSVNVNISPLQLTRPNFVPLVMSILADTGLPAVGVNFEITESVLLRDSDEVIQILNQLRTAGIGVVLDDFGTGYSSLSYLDQLPIDTMKIDRSFVQKDPKVGSEAIVRMILALAQTLDKSVVAEGVETAEQAVRLKEMQCEKVQGYFYSKPMKAEQATEYIVANNEVASNFDHGNQRQQPLF